MLDLMFAGYLLFILPGLQLWKTLRKKKKDAQPDDAATRKAAFFRNMRFILAPLLVLAALLAWTGRGPGVLGLDVPVSALGLWCLLAVVLLLLAMVVGTYVWERGLDAAKTAKYHADLRALDNVPTSRTDMCSTVLLVFCMGIGWELLYRGFLMLVLPPLTGVAGAVILSSLAYGMGHGYHSPKQFAGSIVSAFLFTLGFVFTHSLWWLMLLHVMLPVTGIFGAYSALNKAPRAAPV
jgi:membrane protease YdiL (CAAX protease family)